MALRKKTDETAAKPNPKLVVNQVVVKTLNRQSSDIDTWRSALKNADNGRRNQLHNLYTDMLLDNVLSDAIEKRIEAITNAELTFRVDENEVDEINDLMETGEWEQMLREIMLAKFWGYSVLEFDYTNGFAANSIPRNHVNPKKGIITINEYDEVGVDYRADDFFLEVKGDEKFGLILKACPYVIYKRGDFGDWAQFTELFGMPFRIGKYNSYDEETRAQLQLALEEAGSAAYAVIPKEGDIEYRDNNSKGDGALYDTLRKACNEEILVGLLGQSMTTFQGDKGARSLGEVHMDVQESKHASDRRFISRILNKEILPRLEARGFKVSGGRFDFPEVGETLSLENRVDVDIKLDGIIEIDADYFYETYGIPRPKDGGGKKVKKPEENTPPKGGNLSPSKGDEQSGGGKPKKEKKKEEKMGDDERKWWQRLFSFSFAPRPSAGERRGIANEIDRLYNPES